MTRQEEMIAGELKTLIDLNGKKYLSDEPYEVYKKLVDNDAVDSRIAGPILCALVNGLQDFDSRGDFAAFSKTIQKECSFNKQMADKLATIFMLLYSKEHSAEWEKKENEGMKQFLKENLTFTWKGFAVWQEGNGSIDCHYDATIVLKPLEKSVKDEKIVQLLKKNPFTTKEIIAEYFKEKLCRRLDYVFEEDCTCDDYYPPVVEDFDVGYYVSEWCRKNGFKVVSCEGEGSDGGYEPGFRRGWY